MEEACPSFDPWMGRGLQHSGAFCEEEAVWSRVRGRRALQGVRRPWFLFLTVPLLCDLE